MEEIQKALRVVAFSDTHGHHRNVEIPDGDLLIFAGDFTAQDSYVGVVHFGRWFSKLPHKYKVFVAGNHDWVFQKNYSFAKSCFSSDVIILEDEGCEIENLSIYGTPWQPEFQSWAFNAAPDKLKIRYDAIPIGVDILITHAPARGFLDRVRLNTPEEEHVGCPILRERLEIVKPRYHIFGHVHEDSAWAIVPWSQTEHSLMYNVSICDEYYRVAFRPKVFDIPLGEANGRGES